MSSSQSTTDERLKPTRPLELTRLEAAVLRDMMGDLCDGVSDGGSIPPQHWRTAVNKLDSFIRGWPA